MSHFIRSALSLSLLAIFWPARTPAYSQPPASSEKPTAKRLDLAGLGNLYMELELPLPPKDAGFAIVGGGSTPWRFLRDHPNYGPLLQSDYKYRFATEDPACKGQYLVWKCFDVEAMTRVDQFRTTAPSPEAVLRVMKMDRLDGNDDPSSETEPIFAIQCHLLGHHELAAFFYKRCLKKSRLPLEHWLVVDAWNHWVRKLHHPTGDRATLVKKLKGLADRHHLFQPDREFLDPAFNAHGSRRQPYEQQRIFLDHLEKSLKPVYSAQVKPGSPEWLVDQMVHAADPAHSPWIPFDAPSLWERANQIQQRRRPSRTSFAFQPTEVEQKLIALGFDAIPIMIEHVEDKRLTRHSRPWIGSTGPSPTRYDLRVSDFHTVGERIRNILSCYFNLSIERVNDIWKTKKSDYLAAWKSLSLMKEPDFVTQTIATKKDLNQHFLFLVKAKYPCQAVEIYKKRLLDKQEATDFFEVAFFLVDSQLPKTEKLALLSQGTQHPSPQYQVRSLEGLLELDDATFTSCIRESLSKFPKEWAKNGAAWHHVAILDLAFCSADPATRELAYAQAKKLPVPGRIAQLAHFPWADYRPSKNLTISLMARFLDDQEIYHFDQKHTQEDLWSEFRGFEKIEVRNYAADQILNVLGVGLPLDDKTSEADWAKVREFVEEEVERRLEFETAK